MGKLDPELRAYIDGLAQQLQHTITHSTETTERLASGIVNSVLEVATRVIPTDGFITREYGATIGAIEVFNHGAADDMTVAFGGGSGVKPLQGTGVSRIPAGVSRTINGNSRMVTIYGTPGDYVGFQAFTKGSLGGAGLGGVNGGAP